MTLVKRLDRHNRIWAIPFQQPGAPALVGISYAEAEASAWAIDAEGRRFRGAAAINAALAVSRGWPWLVRLYEIPLVRRVEDAVYDWVARHRRHFPGLTPYCERPGALCITKTD